MSKLKIKRSEYIIGTREFALISLGNDKICVVDSEDYEKLNAHRWKAQKSAGCWYAVRTTVRNNRICQVKMHREITHCLGGFHVHHINRNPLDNRKENLQVCTPEQHRSFHS